MKTPLIFKAVVAVLLLSVTCAFAADPAKLAPADANAFIRINDLAKLRADWENDPLAEYLEDQMPAHQEPQAWRDIQAMLGLSGEQIVDRYFGQVLALFAKGAGEKPPGLVVSHVKPDHAKHAIEKLDLQSLGQFGKFELYEPPDGNGRIAYGDSWMAMGDVKHDTFIRKALTQAGQGKSLADDDQFKKWTAMLPANPTAMAFMRDPDKGETHAVAAERIGKRDVKLSYVGHSPKLGELYGKLGDAKATTFGPLPGSTIAAMSLNIHDRNPDKRMTEVFDRILAPKTFEKDVLPKLSAPAVGFLGELKSDEVEPAAGFSVPVVGWAIHMKDDSAANDLNRLMNTGMTFINLATLNWGVEPVAITQGKLGDVTYTTADVGKALAQKSGRKGVAGAVKITFGQVGDWYIVASHEKFFRACAKAANGGASSLASSQDFKAVKLKEHDGAVMSGFVRAPQLSAHIQTWLDYGRPRYPDVFADADQTVPDRKVGRAVRGLKVLSGILKHYQSFSLQAYRGDEDRLHAEAMIRRSQ